jgi:hypothetical protein
MISFTELLVSRKFDFTQPAILVRHKDAKASMTDLIENGYFELYQSVQTKKSFDMNKYIIVFLGLGSTRALFYNVYEITGKRNPRTIELPSGFPFPEFYDESHSYYDLKPLSGFEDLQLRVVIEWGKGTLAWVQNYTDKEVLEIRPQGFVKTFPHYLDFTLSLTELRNLFKYPEANMDWKNKLSAVNGIYLILDKSNGTQYVGSAYGKDGIWGRWEKYAQTIHGGNKALEELLEDSPDYGKNFQWTVLATLPNNMTNDEIIAYETMYKNKLGSKIYGLNRN